MRSSVPLAYKFIAVVVAVSTAIGLFAFLRYREAQLASAASLSFDPAVAQQLDPGDASAPHPAVVLGQSILSDSVIAGLVPQANIAASSTADATSEFRAHLELTQPAAGLLRVGYRDPDPVQAAATANAVARAITEWSPSTASAPVPAANAHSAPAPAPKPVTASAPAPSHASAAEPPLAAALRELQAQLSAADQQALAKSSQSEHDRQRHLESQARVAQQKLNDLRKEFAPSDSASGGQARLDIIQHALTLFWPSAAGLSTAGTSEAQLGYEREQLTRDIAIIEQQQQAAQRAEAANSASANRRSQQPAPLATQPQPAPAAAVISSPVSGAPANPFHLEQMAGLPAPVVWWPSALVGCFCGLLFWGFSFLRYRASTEPDDVIDVPEENALFANRLLNIDAPVPADSREDWIETYPAKTSSQKRAAFTFDPESISEPVANQPSAPEPPSPEPIQSTMADTVPDYSTEPAESPTPEATVQAASVPDAAPLPAPEEPQEQDKIFHEKTVEAVDPWEEEIRKTLLQTTIARMLDPQIGAEDTAPAKGPTRDAGPPKSEPDRLTG